jgi:hypothetical protein
MDEGGVVRPDQVSLGVLVTAVPRDAVDAASFRTLLPPISLPGRELSLDPILAVGVHTEAILAWLESSTALT